MQPSANALSIPPERTPIRTRPPTPDGHRVPVAYIIHVHTHTQAHGRATASARAHPHAHAREDVRARSRPLEPAPRFFPPPALNDSPPPSHTHTRTRTPDAVRPLHPDVQPDGTSPATPVLTCTAKPDTWFWTHTRLVTYTPCTLIALRFVLLAATLLVSDRQTHHVIMLR